MVVVGTILSSQPIAAKPLTVASTQLPLSMAIQEVMATGMDELARIRQPNNQMPPHLLTASTPRARLIDRVAGILTIPQLGMEARLLSRPSVRTLFLLQHLNPVSSTVIITYYIFF